MHNTVLYVGSDNSRKKGVDREVCTNEFVGRDGDGDGDGGSAESDWSIEIDSAAIVDSIESAKDKGGVLEDECNLGETEGTGTGDDLGMPTEEVGIAGDPKSDVEGGEKEVTNVIASPLKKGCFRRESQSTSISISTASHCSCLRSVQESLFTDSFRRTIRAASSKVSSRSSHNPPSPNNRHNLLHNT